MLKKESIDVGQAPHEASMYRPRLHAVASTCKPCYMARLEWMLPCSSAKRTYLVDGPDRLRAMSPWRTKIKPWDIPIHGSGIVRIVQQTGKPTDWEAHVHTVDRAMVIQAHTVLPTVT